MIINPEFRIPFAFDLSSGSVLEIEQGSDEDIQQRVWVALSYEPGQLQCDPSVGIPDQTFRLGGADLSLIERIIQQRVPDASEIISRDPEWFKTLIDTITIRRDSAS